MDITESFENSNEEFKTEKRQFLTKQMLKTL